MSNVLSKKNLFKKQVIAKLTVFYQFQILIFIKHILQVNIIFSY